MAAQYQKDKMLYIATEYLNKNYMHELYGGPTWKHVVEAIGSRAGADNPKYAEKVAQKHQGNIAPIFTLKFFIKIVIHFSTNHTVVNSKFSLFQVGQSFNNELENW